MRRKVEEKRKGVRQNKKGERKEVREAGERREK